MSDRTAAIVLQLRDQASPEVQRVASRFRELIQETRAAGASQEQAERQALAHAQALAQLAAASGQGARGQQVLMAALSAVNTETVAATRAETALLGLQGRTAREALALADSEIRAARATGDHTRALQLIQTQLAQTSSGTARYNTLLAQQALAQRQAAPGPSALAQGLESLKGGLLGVVGPAALATAAIGAVGATAQSFRDGLDLKTQLDSTNAAVAIQVRQLRDYGQVQREAQAFAATYKLTQQDLATTLQAAVPVFRQSNATTTETLQTFLLLQRTAPEKPISEAARAIRELASGDVTSIKELFNVPAREAHLMKEAIAAGQDPVKVVADYLKRAGADAELLKIGTTGAAGALKDAAQAAEELSLAQGQLAEATVPLIGAQSAATRGLARVLRGELVPSFDEVSAKARLYGDAFRAAQASGQTNQQAQLTALLAVANGTATVTVAAQQAAPAIQGVSGAFTAAATGAQLAADRQAAYNAVARDTITLSGDDIIKKQQQQLATDRLTQFTSDLQAAALRVASGQATQGQEAAALAAKYPELGSQIGSIISRQVNLASTVEAANQKLRDQQLLAQKNATQDLTGGRGPAIGAPGRRGNDVADFERFLAEQPAADEARRAQQLALADTAGRVRLLKDELAALKAKGAAEDVIIAKTTEVQLAERQLAEEQERAATRAGKAGDTRVRAAQTTALQLGNLARSSAEEIERIQRDSLQRLADMQQDFDVRRSRATEDYERRRRRLLAEGKIFEANQLKEEFEREQRRAQEDLERARARQQREVADRLGDQGARVDRSQDTIAARAAIRGVTPATSALPLLPPAQPTQAVAGDAATVATRAPIRVEIDFAPIQLTCDGAVLAEVVYPRVEQLLIEDANRISVTAPPELAARAAGGR